MLTVTHLDILLRLDDTVISDRQSKACKDKMENEKFGIVGMHILFLYETIRPLTVPQCRHWTHCNRTKGAARPSSGFHSNNDQYQ